MIPTHSRLRNGILKTVEIKNFPITVYKVTGERHPLAIDRRQVRYRPTRESGSVQYFKTKSFPYDLIAVFYPAFYLYRLYQNFCGLLCVIMKTLGGHTRPVLTRLLEIFSFCERSDDSTAQFRIKIPSMMRQENACTIGLRSINTGSFAICVNLELICVPKVTMDYIGSNSG